MNELTGKQALAVLNTHIENVIKGTCGPEKEDHSWGLNEINSILHCIATLSGKLDELQALQEKEKSNKNEEKKGK